MILTFSRPEFKDKIISGTKTTTIRADKTRRWHADRSIQFWMHNPRNKSKSPHLFAVGKAISVFQILIYPNENYVCLRSYNDIHYSLTKKYELDNLARKDGFEDW